MSWILCAMCGEAGITRVTNALSKEYILLSKITQENYDKSIPAVRELWESQGPRSKKDLFYIIVYQNYLLNSNFLHLLINMDILLY